MTNPKFELWTLLHFEDSRDSLDTVVNSRNPSKAVDRELEKRTIPSKDYDFSELVKNLDVAMENSKRLTEDLQELEDSVGTNMPALVRHLRGKKG